MIREEAPLTYHTVTLGTLTREGTTLAEITEQNEIGEQHTRTTTRSRGPSRRTCYDCN